MLPLHALLFSHRVLVVYPGLITGYYARRINKSEFDCMSFLMFIQCFASTILHFLIMQSGDPSCIYLCHKRVFLQDRLNRTSANAHSVSYLVHIDSTALRNNIFHCATAFFTDSIRWAFWLPNVRLWHVMAHFHHK